MTLSIDEPVGDEVELYRRGLPELGLGLVEDKNRDRVRLSSAVFAPQEMSVLIEDALREDGRVPLDALANFPDDFLIAITVLVARSQSQTVVRSPTEVEPAHGDVIGKKTRGRRREMARRARWVKEPVDLCVD